MQISAYYRICIPQPSFIALLLVVLVVVDRGSEFQSSLSMRLHPGQAGRRVRHMFTVQQLKWNIISDLSRFKGALQIQLKVPIDRSSQIVWFNQQQSI